MVEDFFVSRCLGRRDIETLSGRQLEAMVILESNLAREKNDGQRNSGQPV